MERVPMGEGRAALGGKEEGGPEVGDRARPCGALTFRRTSGFSLGAVDVSGRDLRQGPSVSSQ